MTVNTLSHTGQVDIGHLQRADRVTTHGDTTHFQGTFNLTQLDVNTTTLSNITTLGPDGLLDGCLGTGTTRSVELQIVNLHSRARSQLQGRSLFSSISVRNRTISTRGCSTGCSLISGITKGTQIHINNFDSGI